MESLFFGSSDQRVLGIYHSADFSKDRGEGVVLCYPFGQEYMRAHRAYRQLASGLSKLGYHVLRFDYRGTGDSYGDLDNALPSMWLDDVRTAVEELADISGCRKISLLGLRLGALLAQQVAFSETKISRLVLWDPIVSGQAFIDEIKDEISLSGESNSKFIDQNNTIHFNGFSISSSFQNEVPSLSVNCAGTGPQKALLIISHETPDFSDLKASLSTNNHNLTFLHEPAPHDWNYVDHVGGILLPSNLLNKILEWFK